MIASSQLQMIAQQHSLARPNTSPTPTGMFADLRKPGARHNNNGVSAHHQRELNTSKLRPLPPKQMLTGHYGGGSGSGGFSMMIEGSKTGEEKTISLVERREATQQRPAAAERKLREKPPMAQRVKPEFDFKDKMIKKLELELKRANATIREKTTENDTVKSKVSTLEGSLSKQEKENGRLKSNVALLTSSNETKDSEIANLTAALKRHEEGANSQGAESRRLTQELDVMAIKQSSAETKLTKERAAWEKERTDMLAELTSSKAEAALAKSKAAEGDTSLSKRQQLIEIERQNARDRESALQSEVRKAKKQVEESEKKLVEWKDVVESCNSYILNICQPSFSVVKDENLTPVTPGVNTPDGGGFVLVPLPLLLEGYGLLPGNLKQKIAQDYEKTKSEAPAAGNFATMQQQQAPASRGSSRTHSLTGKR